VTDPQRALIDRLFEEACALPTAECHAYLTAQCADAAVVAEVESLLDFARSPDGTLSRPIAAARADFHFEPALPPEPMIGPYRILSALGEGGMGAVYKAVRSDDFRKTVAIKVLNIDARSEADQRRFRQERQILAELEHPNIARLIDGGANAQGLPYIVMEYVEGRRIDKYCIKNKLPVAERLRLFRKVCDAVQYAHQKLIVHRDIKPGNILVTAGGEPKLLDFGIAKLLASGAASDDAPKTITGLQRMTPDYASPEQVRGGPVSVATDVYGLGTVLFELLTRQRPHRLKNYDMAEILEEVCVAEVRRPSDTGGDELRGDLDTIVMKAMQKEPARRYNSVEQLSEDIRRHLEGYPVRARPDTLRYRTRKFLRRNWVPVGAATIVALSLAGGIVAARLQARRAEARSQQVRKLANTFLFDVENRLRLVPGSTETQDVVVKSALQYLNSLAADAGNDPQLQSELASAYEKVGDLQGFPGESSLGDSRAAERYYEKAAALRESVWRGHPRDWTETRKLASTYAGLSFLRLYNGESAAAMRDGQRSVDLAQAVADAHPGAADDMVLLGRCLNKLGDTEDAAGHLESSLSYYQRARDLRQAVLNAKPTPLARVLVALDSIEIGRIERRMGKLAEADATLLAAKELVTPDLEGSHPYFHARRVIAELEPALADAYGDPRNGDRAGEAKAMVEIRAGLDTAAKLVADDPKDSDAAGLLAADQNGLAKLLAGTHPAEAAGLAQKALTAWRALAQRNPLDLAWRARLAQALAIMGEMQARLGQTHEALRLTQEALERQPQDPPPGVTTRWPRLTHRYEFAAQKAELQARLEDFAGARESAREAARLAAAARSALTLEFDNVLDLASTFERVGDVFRQLRTDSDLAEAAAAFEQRAQLWTEFRAKAARNAFVEAQWTLAQNQLADCRRVSAFSENRR
jgi:eukaryotic-like serine/threonine-protein kinase